MRSQSQELKERVNAKQKELEAEISRLKADARGGARGQIERLEGKLAEMREVLRDGWDRVTEAGAAKLNRLLES